MNKYRETLVKKLESKLNSGSGILSHSVILWSVVAALIVLLSGCESLKLCHGEKVCKWQNAAPMQCPEPQKMPPELTKRLRLQTELDQLLSMPPQ